MKDEDKAKLKTLFGYWIEHNREHGEEFKEWAGKIKESGEAEIADELLKAAEVMDNATEHLVRASDMFGKKE
ncbi:hypothetical protein ACFLYN_01875 [Chloroflexota bacterium]